MVDSPQGLERGERAPDFVLPLLNGTPTRFYAKAGGRPTVLVFFDADRDERVQACCATLCQINGDDVDILGIRRGESGAPTDAWSFPVFVADAAGRIRAAYRLGTDDALALGFVLDPNLRVLGTVSVTDPASAAQRVRELLSTGLPRIEPRQIDVQAPVLLIPHVLERQVCDLLMRFWETQGHVMTGVEQSQAGRRANVVDPVAKSRHDHTVTDADLLRRLTTTVGRRVLPEVRRAFAYTATRFEGFKIACYDADLGGFFGPHRDNLSPATAHRRFALTLNLNDGYTGGCLRFPEYGPHLYRPGPGEAIVFSGALLHEVTPVVEGRRFTLLSFLFGEEGIRRASASASSPETRR